MSQQYHFSPFHELSLEGLAQIKLLKNRGVTPDKIAAMFGVSPDMLSLLEDINVSNGKPENVRRRIMSHVVTK